MPARLFLHHVASEALDVSSDENGIYYVLLSENECIIFKELANNWNNSSDIGYLWPQAPTALLALPVYDNFYYGRPSFLRLYSLY